jgi:general secretion pathway protein D
MRRTAVFALALLVAAPLRARADEQLQLNFKDATPAAVVEAIARATGTRIVMEPGLRGQLTIALEDKVSPAEALEVLNAALLTIGFAPVPAPGGGFVILPIESARGAAPWIHRSVSESSERMVTTLVRLQSAKADDLAKQLAPADRSSLIVPYPPTNSLIIAAAEDRIAYLLEIMRALDQAAQTRLEVLPLRYADASVVATQLATVFTPKSQADTRPEVPFKVVVDPRTNSLIVDAPPSRQAEVRRYIDLVDMPKRSKSGIHVVRVMNADAVKLAEKLTSVSLDEAPSTKLKKLSGKSYSVIADEPTNSLLITADAATFGLLADVISELDRIPTRIAIEVAVFAVETTHALDLGFDAVLPLIVPDDAGDVVAFAAFGNPVPLIEQEVRKVGPFLARFTRQPLLLPIIGPDGNPTTIVAPGGGAQITAAEGDVTVSILSSPYLLAASGEEQHIFAGENVPIPVSASPAAGTTGTTTGNSSTTTPGAVSTDFVTSQSIERQDVGIDLHVKPVSLSEHLSALDLQIEVKSVQPSVGAIERAQDTQLGQTLNEFKVEANVRLTDGSVVLLASAPRDKTEAIEGGVPFFSKIPILGWLFKSTSDRLVRRRIIATVQATQLHSPSEERAEQMERVLAFERRALRIQPLRGLVSEPYALLVATRGSREAAELLLTEISDLPGDPLVVEWIDGELPRFDVYLAGFREIAQLGNEAVTLRQRGFSPRLEIARNPTP